MSVHTRLYLRTLLILVGALCLLQGARAQARGLSFTSLNVSEGLSQNTVYAIHQDRQGFMWFGTKDGLNRYDGTNFRIYDAHDESHGLDNNFITALAEDQEGYMWVGTDTGLYRYDSEEDHFYSFDLTSQLGESIAHTVTSIVTRGDDHVVIAVEEQGLFEYDISQEELTQYKFSSIRVGSNIQCLAVDNFGVLWVGFYGDGLYYAPGGANSFVPCSMEKSGKEERPFEGDVVTSILVLPDNQLLVSSQKGGVKAIGSSRVEVTDILQVDQGDMSDIFCRALLYTQEGEVWIGSEQGLFVYSTSEHAITHHFTYQAVDPDSLGDNAVYSLYQDRLGRIWIGTYFDGVNYIPSDRPLFRSYKPHGNPSGLRGRRIREFCEDGRGVIWIGSEDAGLHKMDPKSGEIEYFQPSEMYENIHGLCMVTDDQLWVGTFSNGIHVIDIHTNREVKSYTKENTGGALNDNNIFAIFKTSRGEVLIGTLFGLLVYDHEYDTFREVDELSGSFIYDIAESSDGTLWFATYAHGAYQYDYQREEWVHHTHRKGEGGTGSLPYDKVLSVVEDSRGDLWLTTQGGGVAKYLPESKSFKSYTTSDGLPNNIVYQVVEDEQGLLWMSTNGGLALFDPATEHFRSLTHADGVPCEQFNYRSGIRASSGELYFGSIDGFMTFDPERVIQERHTPTIVLTEFSVLGREMEPGADASPLSKSITHTDKIVLGARQNSFSLRMADLSFRTPASTRVRYKLEEADSEWTIASISDPVIYSNLSPGRYRFVVKSLDDEEGVALGVTVRPPLLRTPVAYLIYLLLISGGIYMIYIQVRNKRRQKEEQARQQLERESERELYHAKLDFFTDLAHEIRTPLTLIKAPLENILDEGGDELSEQTSEDLQVMKRNTDHLLNLTNQLLDFRKAEVQGYKLNVKHTNITSLVYEVLDRFTSAIENRNISFVSTFPKEEVYADVNKEALSKIISNLLSNSVKYSKSKVSIALTSDETSMYIRTSNDGALIPVEMREEIFEPFVRHRGEAGESHSGTGIGLPLARSLAELHGGSLEMDGGDSERNTFVVVLPLRHKEAIQVDSADGTAESYTYADPDAPQADESATEDALNTILVVEDNIEMAQFIARLLSSEYRTLIAPNGKAALPLLEQYDVHLIVSDIVMPEMDGLELCKAVKTNVSYSHIPVVLLTAKSNLHSVVDGLEMGADAYIEKPFSVSHLKAQIENLLANRLRLRTALSQDPFLPLDTIALTKADEEFIAQLKSITEKNLSDSDFSVDELAQEMGMSRSAFYRKMRGIMDVTPNEYLRLERLKMAATLLREGTLRVNEVCYNVGFSSPSYFSKCFRDQFGISPKDY
ncbi:MAG: two-component regulator propeller domain-containing protein [Porphyromonas sp.]|nr:two-component regulator propeller domain-containing protein [Porphyromonas sp.]